MTMGGRVLTWEGRRAGESLKIAPVINPAPPTLPMTIMNAAPPINATIRMT
jgi:hypothetical protein